MSGPAVWTLRLVADGAVEATIELLEDHLESEEAFVQDAWHADRGAFALVRAILVRERTSEGRGFVRRLVAWARGREVDLSLIAGEDEAPERGWMVFDADSTLVDGEGIDELAARAGVESQVAGITARAMAGELDYARSLHERVALLRGLSSTDLDAVASALRLNPGAEEAVRACHAEGWRVAVISGGFDFYLRELQRRLGVDAAFGNRLAVRAGVLTGKVQGQVLGAEAKRDRMLALREGDGLTARAIVAVGDGANDAPMLREAGIGLGYRPKPSLLSEIDGVICRRDLRAAVALAGLVD